MAGRVAVVTDSTAYLPADIVSAMGIRVVALPVLIGTRAGAEGIDVTPAEVASALLDRRSPVTTSRPAPADFAGAYAEAFRAGASSVLSVHLSGELSGTWQSAAVAAKDAAGEVRVLDSRSTAMGLGFAVMAAAQVAAAGGSVEAVAAAARDCVERTTMMFYVDTLEYLRRGGRIGATAALLGTALSVKPILHLVDGGIVLLEKVRTAGRGLTRLEELTVDSAGDGPVDVAVHHLAAPQRAAAIADRLQARLPALQRLLVAELGAAVGAHVGPGVVGVVVVRAPAAAHK
ncbi:MAG: DegV family protein [Actinomycetota bacterium]|nr:DegV family protein [Actinomycetota bacterium]